MTEPNVMQFLHVSSEGWYYQRHGNRGIIYVSVPGLNDPCTQNRFLQKGEKRTLNTQKRVFSLSFFFSIPQT